MHVHRNDAGSAGHARRDQFCCRVACLEKSHNAVAAILERRIWISNVHEKATERRDTVMVNALKAKYSDQLR